MRELLISLTGVIGVVIGVAGTLILQRWGRDR